MEVTIVTNVRKGDILYFPNRKYKGRPVKRKVYCLDFCTLNERNVHHRIAYKMGDTIHEPLLSAVLSLNPQLETKNIKVELKIGVEEGVFQGERTDLYYRYIEYEGVKSRVGRYWIKNGDDIWYLN